MGRITNQNHVDYNEVFELQTGMLNSHFYHPCQFCKGEGGTHHVFFNCKGIKIILKELEIEIDLKNIVGSILSKEDAYKANIIIKLIIFFNKHEKFSSY